MQAGVQKAGAGAERSKAGAERAGAGAGAEGAAAEKTLKSFITPVFQGLLHCKADGLLKAWQAQGLLGLDVGAILSKGARLLASLPAMHTTQS